MGTRTAIDVISAALQGVPSVRALFLGGSYGAGIEDAYSDIDFVAVSSDGPSDSFSTHWRDAVGRVGEIVLWWDRQGKPALINAVTVDWLRLDVVIVTPDQMRERGASGLKLLFDHDEISSAVPVARQSPSVDPSRIKWQIEEFIRIIGLLPVAIGRGEYLNGITGIFHLRNLLIALLIEETAAPDRGGALHLNRLISEEQKRLLAALPVPLPTREAVIAANIAYAEAYLPRARRMAEEIGVEWPQRFEQATRSHLRKALSVELTA